VKQAKRLQSVVPQVDFQPAARHRPPFEAQRSELVAFEQAQMAL
jgi:hypothetical protein